MTAEELKATMEEYRREHFPAGRWASAMFDAGPDAPPETLVLTPGVSASPPPSSGKSGPESPAAPARSS